MTETIRLEGITGEHHATGRLDHQKLMTCGNIVRNGHHYAFSGQFTDEHFPIYREVPTPWDVTAEFEAVQ